MLPMPVKASVRRTPSREHRRYQIAMYALLAVLVVSCLYMLRFFYSKCDTRAPMAVLLTKTARILQRHDIEYWLDKGTLLGVHRDDGLIPWEYDIDLGVMNATCDKISAFKDEFEAVGLHAYDRNDYIAHKVKLTYDTENHHFYWSDAHIHDPCVRVYDAADLSQWVDIYWYVELDAKQVAANRENVLIPPKYDWNSSLLCCSEGLKEYTEHMCCGGCVPVDTVYPLQEQMVPVTDGIHLAQKQYLPHQVAKYLQINYGDDALTHREIKGWKGVVCGFWTTPGLFAVYVVLLLVLLVGLVVFCRRRCQRVLLTKRRIQ